jgi:hypothetical protein
VGPQTVVLTAQSNSNAKALDRFVAMFELPRLSVGEYRVEFRKDDCPWVTLPDQLLNVRTDPIQAKEFSIADALFGGCRANDQDDDSTCLKRALAAAKNAGNGTVVLGAGSWILGNTGDATSLVVPDGVSIRGEGSQKTVLINATTNRAVNSNAMLILMGRNSIRGISFRDTRDANHRPPKGQGTAAIQLGLIERESQQNSATRQSTVVDISIANNVFDRVERAIVDSGQPMRNLFITHNVFGAYAEDIDLGGNRFLVNDPFRIDDAVIAFNQFAPGSYIDVASRQGVIASELGAGHRVDFSNNTANGAEQRFLDSPSDPRGWRAAFFWHMNNNQEKILVAENVATCTGDKVGDGEAFSFDNNANTFAFDAPRMVLNATENSITVDGLPLPTQNSRTVTLDKYYADHYVQVGDGPGVGQVRKIRSYTIDNENARTSFTVSPDWDVPPKANASRIHVGREFSHLFVIANTVDHRTPLCAKSNRSDKRGGSIGIAGQTSDSSVEGNWQYDTDGIIFHELFSAQDKKCPDCNRGTHYVSFLDIRGNQILGEYDWLDDCSSSGIFGSVAASPDPIASPTTVGYGVSISHNNIVGADGWRGGAIALTPTWYVGPAPSKWPIAQSTLIHHNTIDSLSAAPARQCKQDRMRSRIGINLGGSSLVPNTVLYANTCRGTATKLFSGVQSIVTICPGDLDASCECSTGR